MAGWSTFACLYVMFGRLFYPYELEWMTGAILDHIERVQHGEPIYTQPTASWIPFLYPPLYYWVAAAVARVLPLVIACRTVSIASSLVQAACVWRLARCRGASRYWSTIGIGAFFAAYALVDFWYDIERPDSLFMALVLVGAVILDETRGVVGAIASGLLLALAFFAKQPALLFILAAGAALVARGEWKRASAFGIASATLVLGLVKHLNATTGGWFAYYVLAMPRAHGMSLDLVPGFLLTDLPRAWAWVLATCAILGAFAFRRWRRPGDAVFVAFLAASFVASASSRLHVGGWANVLSFWTAFASAAIAVCGSRLEALLTGRHEPTADRVASMLPAVVVVQLLARAYIPADCIPVRASVARFHGLIDEIHELEKNGEVLAMGRGHLTTQRHFHIASLVDVLTVEHAIPEDVKRAFRERRFAAIVIDNMDDLLVPLRPELKGELFYIVSAGYYVASRLDERVRDPVLGWPAKPRWVLLPRQTRLDETDRASLRRRSFTELTIAQMRETAAREGTTFERAEEPGEAIAEVACDRAFEGATDHPDAGDR